MTGGLKHTQTEEDIGDHDDDTDKEDTQIAIAFFGTLANMERREIYFFPKKIVSYAKCSLSAMFVGYYILKKRLTGRTAETG